LGTDRRGGEQANDCRSGNERDASASNAEGVIHHFLEPNIRTSDAAESTDVQPAGRSGVANS
jgi:hypothetical protein